MSDKLKLFFKKNYISILLFVTTFIIYVNGISPSVFGGDSGDFLTAIITKGIPHPSGYPLYTLSGIIFENLPLGHTAAWRVGVASSLFASLSVVFMYLISYELVKNKAIAVISSLTLAFIYPFWIYAEVAEVFSLHFLFILLISFILIRYINSRSNKYLYLLSFVIGLSLTNNLTILLILPGVGLSIIITDIKIFKNVKLIIRCFLLLVLGLIPYLYIPIAASYNPVVNWDRAVTLKNFFDLVLRKDYAWFDSTNSPFYPYQYLRSFYVYWKEYINPIIPITSFFGFIYLIKQKKRNISFFLFLSLLLFGPFYIIYSKVLTVSLFSLALLERFYVAPVIILLIYFSCGLKYLIEITNTFIKHRSVAKYLVAISLASFAFIPISFFILNISKTNLKNVYIGDNLGKNILSTLDQNSYLFVANDEFAFNTLYMQNAYGYRKDVTIPGRNTGFEKFLETSKIMKTEEINDYLIENRNTVLQEDMYGGIASLLESGYSVYSTIPKLIIENKLGTLATVPHGLLYKFTIGKESVPAKDEYFKQQDVIMNGFNLEEFDTNDFIVDYSLTLSAIKKHYADGYKNIANFMKLYFKDETMYEKYMDLSTEIDPLLSEPEMNNIPSSDYPSYR